MFNFNIFTLEEECSGCRYVELRVIWRNTKHIYIYSRKIMERDVFVIIPWWKNASTYDWNKGYEDYEDLFKITGDEKEAELFIKGKITDKDEYIPKFDWKFTNLQHSEDFNELWDEIESFLYSKKDTYEKEMDSVCC